MIKYLNDFFNNGMKKLGDFFNDFKPELTVIVVSFVLACMSTTGSFALELYDRVK